MKGCIRKRASPFNFSDEQKILVLRWFQANPILKTESSEFRYAKHLPLRNAQALNYTDIVTGKLCTNKQLFNLTKVVEGVKPDRHPDNLSDVQKELVTVWKGTGFVQYTKQKMI